MMPDFDCLVIPVAVVIALIDTKHLIDDPWLIPRQLNPLGLGPVERLGLTVDLIAWRVSVVNHALNYEPTQTDRLAVFVVFELLLQPVGAVIVASLVAEVSAAGCPRLK